MQIFGQAVGRERRRRFGIFLGANGLRAGWRVLLFFVIALVVGDLGFLLLVRPCLEHGFFVSAPAKLFLYRMWFFLPLLAAAAIMARLEARSMAAYGLDFSQNSIARLVEGAVWGLCAFSLLAGALWSLNACSIRLAPLTGTATWNWGLQWTLAFFAVGLLEEYAARGYPFYTFGSAIGFWPSAVLLSVSFGVIHIQNQSWIGVLGVVLVALFFCWTLRCTGSLWFAVGCHGAFDWAAAFLFGVPERSGRASGHLLEMSVQGPAWLTGGSFGPESGVLVIPLVLLMWVVFTCVIASSPQARSRNC